MAEMFEPDKRMIEKSGSNEVPEMDEKESQQLGMKNKSGDWSHQGRIAQDEHKAWVC